MGKIRGERTDADYVALDEAIGTLRNWYPWIIDELPKHNVSESTFQRVLEALNNVHSPKEG